MGNILHCCVLQITFPGCLLATNKTMLVGGKTKEKIFCMKRNEELKKQLVSVYRA